MAGQDLNKTRDCGCDEGQDCVSSVVAALATWEQGTPIDDIFNKIIMASLAPTEKEEQQK
jgi:hypothetical protein